MIVKRNKPPHFQWEGGRKAKRVLGVRMRGVARDLMPAAASAVHTGLSCHGNGTYHSSGPLYSLLVLATLPISTCAHVAFDPIDGLYSVESGFL